MNETLTSGNLAETPFPRILAEIWKNRRTGRLSLRTREVERTFSFEGGSLSVEEKFLPQQDFLDFLASRGLLDPAGLETCRELAGKAGGTVLRAVADSGLIDSGRLWTSLEGFSKELLLPFFDQPEADYTFETSYLAPGQRLLKGISLPALILDGVRRMQNFGFMEAHLPSEGEPLQPAAADTAEALPLSPPEQYIREALESSGTLRDLLDESALGERETKRVLYALLVLDLVGASPAKAAAEGRTQDSPSADADKIFQAFNDKFSYIFKYISKELGPVAINIIEKSLDEVKPRIDPVFRNCEVKPDGRLDIKASVRINLSLAGEEARRNLLRSLDEILSTAVLAVKRTLGSGHEADLIKSLEKVGEPY